jgi:hypothetical protein
MHVPGGGNPTPLGHMMSLLQQRWMVAQQPPPPEGLTAARINQFPTNALKDGADEGGCCICLDDMVGGEEIRRLPCFHFFHTHCIDEWLGRSKACPICKLDL